MECNDDVCLCTWSETQLLSDSQSFTSSPAPPGDEDDVEAHFVGHHKDDGGDPHFNRTDLPHSDAMFSAFRAIFGLTGFRKNQLPAINAALLGLDTFILMPTGA